MGQVCQKHHEFYEKECRWCEPTQVAAPAYPTTHPKMASGVLLAPPLSYIGLTYNPQPCVTVLGWPMGGYPFGTPSE